MCPYFVFGVIPCYQTRTNTPYGVFIRVSLSPLLGQPPDTTNAPVLAHSSCLVIVNMKYAPNWVRISCSALFLRPDANDHAIWRVRSRFPLLHHRNTTRHDERARLGAFVVSCRCQHEVCAQLGAYFMFGPIPATRRERPRHMAWSFLFSPSSLIRTPSDTTNVPVWACSWCLMVSGLCQ